MTAETASKSPLPAAGEKANRQLASPFASVIPATRARELTSRLQRLPGSTTGDGVGFYVRDDTTTPTGVPVVGALPLFGLGMLLLGMARRRLG